QGPLTMTNCTVSGNDAPGREGGGGIWNFGGTLTMTATIVAAIENDAYDPGDCDITVSSLVNSPRIVALTQQHRSEITEDVGDHLYRLFGSGMHAVLEQAGKTAGAITEERLYADLWSARSGGAHGFFALTLDVPTDMPSPRLSITGVKVYGVNPRRLKSLKAGGTVTVTGRCIGSGEAQVLLVSGSRRLSGTVTFSDAIEPNHPASRLWAIEEIERLGTSSPDRTIEIAMRFGLPSKYTSWLAIPAAERKNFARQIMQARYDNAHRELEKALLDPSVPDRKIRAALERIEDLTERLELDHGVRRSRLRDPIDSARDSSLQEYVKAVALNGERSRQARLHRRLLDRIAKLGGRKLTAEETRQVAKDLGISAAKRYANSVINGDKEQDSLALSKAIDSRFGLNTLHDGTLDYAKNRALTFTIFEEADARLRPLFDEGFVERGELKQAVLETMVQREMRELVWWIAAVASRPVIDRQSDPYRRFLVLTDKHGLPDYRDYRGRFESGVRSTLRELAKEIEQGRGGQQRAAEIRTGIRLSLDLLGFEDDWAWSVWLRSYTDDVARSYRRENLILAKDLQKLDRIMSRLRYLCAELQISPDVLIASEPNIGLREAYVLARRAGDTKSAEELAAKILRDSSWKGLERSRSWLEVFAVETELDRLQDMEMTPALQEQLDLLMTQRKLLRARLGDPLAWVVAPKDAKLVIAKLPNGELKRMAWHEGRQRWELRFDIPAWMEEGEFTMPIMILHSDGRTEQVEFKVLVDMTAPTVSVEVTLVDGRVRIDVTTDRDATRAEIHLANGELAALDKVGEGAFVGWFSPGQMGGIAYVAVTDKVNNRTTVEVRR
ncbi:MAG: hypothetical protein IH945_12945, partial [Armatimonadetes bacterium]|nr:hypothetical protein [Armatimonadota bacterium]